MYYFLFLINHEITCKGKVYRYYVMSKNYLLFSSSMPSYLHIYEYNYIIELYNAGPILQFLNELEKIMSFGLIRMNRGKL